MPSRPASSNPYSGIKQYLTTEACSTSTLKLLNEAFSAPESIITSATLKVSARSKNTKSTSKNTAAAEAVTIVVSSASKALERYKLAIDVINTCLKALGDAAKKDTLPASATTLEGSKPSRKTSKPLQSRSASRNEIKLDSIVHLALCCALSISYLNSTQHASNLPELPPLQVETAQNNLVQKLIQLGMFEAGLKEARSLKRKLGEHMQNGVVDAQEVETEISKGRGTLKSTSAKSRAVGKGNVVGAVKPEKESFSKIIEFKQVITSKPEFPLVISCQLGILRCLVGMKRPELIEVRISSGC